MARRSFPFCAARKCAAQRYRARVRRRIESSPLSLSRRYFHLLLFAFNRKNRHHCILGSFTLQNATLEAARRSSHWQRPGRDLLPPPANARASCGLGPGFPGPRPPYASGTDMFSRIRSALRQSPRPCPWLEICTSMCRNFSAAFRLHGLYQHHGRPAGQLLPVTCQQQVRATPCDVVAGSARPPIQPWTVLSHSL